MRHFVYSGARTLLRRSTNICSNFGRTSKSRFLSAQADNPDSWIRSTLPDIECPKGVTVPEYLKATIGPWGDQTAFECGLTGRKYTHNQVHSMSRSFAAALIQAGFKKGDCVAIVLPNIPEYASVMFGIWEAGLISSPVNPSYTPDEMLRQFKTAEAKAVVTLSHFLPTIQTCQGSAEYTDLKSVILIGSSHEGCHSFSEMVKVDPRNVTFPSEFNTQEEISLLPFSSGTTGVPKGVCLTQYNLLSNLMQCMIPELAHVKRRTGDEYVEKLFALLPFFHLYGLSAFLHCGVYRGAHTLCMPKFDAESFLSGIRRHKPTVLHLVPPLINLIVQSPEFGMKELESVQVVWSGAASTGPALTNRLLEKAGKFIMLREGYGMTELSPASHMTPPNSDNAKLGSCGIALPNTLTKIVDVATGNSLGRNERGEIWVKGPQVMKGYYKNDAATRNTINSEGWLQTGDVGYFDEQGYLYIVDRIKELIKVKGFQVSPSELEDLLRKHTLIADVGVIGIPSDEWGELPRAYIVRKDVSLGEAEVNLYLKDKVAYYKQLRGGIEFVKEIPKSAAGKILRRVLSDKYKHRQIENSRFI